MGQAGVQIASACWELFCLEHGILPNGTMYSSVEPGMCNEDNLSTFFDSNCVEGRCIPRVLLIDMEPTPIDEIRMGSYRCLFHPEFTIAGKEDSANNFGRGYNTIGCEMIELVIDKVRRLLEMANAPQGIISYRAVGGGTGSGFCDLIYEKIRDHVSKLPILEWAVFPSPQYGW